jgi:hypothetical protein
VKAGRKPGSVLRIRPRAGPEGDHLSGTAVTGGLERHMEVGTGKSANRCPWALLPAGVYRAGTSRCRWCALTAPLHPCLIPTNAAAAAEPSAVCFCGTVLTVTRTGRYPAGLAVREPGLSSTGPATAPKARQTRRSRSPRLLSQAIYGGCRRLPPETGRPTQGRPCMNSPLPGLLSSGTSDAAPARCGPGHPGL